MYTKREWQRALREKIEPYVSQTQHNTTAEHNTHNVRKWISMYWMPSIHPSLYPLYSKASKTTEQQPQQQSHTQQSKFDVRASNALCVIIFIMCVFLTFAHNEHGNICTLYMYNVHCEYVMLCWCTVYTVHCTTTKHTCSYRSYTDACIYLHARNRPNNIKSY